MHPDSYVKLTKQRTTEEPMYRSTCATNVVGGGVAKPSHFNVPSMQTDNSLSAKIQRSALCGIYEILVTRRVAYWEGHGRYFFFRERPRAIQKRWRARLDLLH